MREEEEIQRGQIWEPAKDTAQSTMVVMAGNDSASEFHTWVCRAFTKSLLGIKA